MSALLSTVIFSVLEILRVSTSNISAPSDLSAMNSDDACIIITDLTVSFSSSTDAPDSALDPSQWYCIDKDLYLHTAQQSAWLHIAQARETSLTADDLVITNIKVGELDAADALDNSWESRPGGIWVLRSSYTGDSQHAVTGVDVLFGVDAVDPRPQWTLTESPLQLNAQPEVPVARLTIRHGIPTLRPDVPALRAREDGTFKMLQISDTHMVTGVGVCTDAMDAYGQPLPTSEADPLTVKFLEGILDLEEPDLVILAGDQLHHGIPDTQSALFKVVAPLIERSIPYAPVFGNHDDEGAYALSRKEQMSILQDLPFSLCEPGPEQIDGIGNYYHEVFSHSSSELPLATLFFLDSHGEIESEVKDPDYDWIKQSQIEWFTYSSRMLRRAREKDGNYNYPHVSLAFMHIPIPEYGDSDLTIKAGQRGEPTEGPSFNSHFYDALVREGVVAVGCGHDHVNDFCGLLPQHKNEGLQQHGSNITQLGPWLCYGGGSGFGGYGSYDGKQFYRRTRVWELDLNEGGIKTWKRVEYDQERVDELALVEWGVVIAPTQTA
ncbi:Metallo-dependent phosphatase-like protein [Hypomontagnella monticulosa]|nr:Metallo-dependent phosphatase-like protein [Hypomontagnella monticulosa]